MPDKDKQTLWCSFCGKSQHDVIKLIAGFAVFICNECVETCVSVLESEGAALAGNPLERLRVMRQAATAREAMKVVETILKREEERHVPFGELGKMLSKWEADDWPPSEPIALHQKITSASTDSEPK